MPRVQDNASVIHLMLDNNQIDTNGGCAFARALVVNGTLLKLDLAWNPLKAQVDHKPPFPPLFVLTGVVHRVSKQSRTR